MRNYLNLFNPKARLLCLGSALVIAPVTSTFAILPMISQVFELSPVTVASANQQQEESDNHYSDAQSNSLTSSSYRNVLKNYDTQFSEANTEQEPIISLSENTIIMRANSSI